MAKIYALTPPQSKRCRREAIKVGSVLSAFTPTPFKWTSQGSWVFQPLQALVTTQ